jgi:hypothetical protein
MTLDSALLTAGAAAFGSLIGAAATVLTTWITQRHQAIRGSVEWNLRERAAVYGEFIIEASRVAADALQHSFDEPEKLVALYGVLGRIRLISGDEVLREAEGCVRQIVSLYSQPNLTPEQIRDALEEHRFDPMQGFSSACRRELQKTVPALLSAAGSIKVDKRALSGAVAL